MTYLCSIYTSLDTLAQGPSRENFGCFTVSLLFLCNTNSEILYHLVAEKNLNYIKLIYTHFNHSFNQKPETVPIICDLWTRATGFVYVYVSSLSKHSEFVYELVMLRVPDRAEQEKDSDNGAL